MKQLIFFSLLALGLLLTACGVSSFSTDYAKDWSEYNPADADAYRSYQESKWDEMASAEATRIILETMLDCGGDENITGEEYQSCIQRSKGQVSTSAPPSSPRCISWTDAAKNIGNNTCVYGVVYNTYKDPNSTAFFINFDNTRSSFYGVSFKWIWSGLNGQCVELYGTISTYSGRPQIVIENEEQIRRCTK